MVIIDNRAIYRQKTITVSKGTELTIKAMADDSDSDKLNYKWLQITGEEIGVDKESTESITFIIISSCSLICKVQDNHGGFTAKVININVTGTDDNR